MQRVSSEKIIMQIMHTGETSSYCLLLMGPAGWYFGRLDFASLCTYIYRCIITIRSDCGCGGDEDDDDGDDDFEKRVVRARGSPFEESEVMRDDFRKSPPTCGTADPRRPLAAYRVHAAARNLWLTINRLLKKKKKIYKEQKISCSSSPSRVLYYMRV